MASRSATTSSEAFEHTFRELRSGGRSALVVYVTAGHPDPERSLTLLRGLGSAGADVIEVGVPFSDPIADGPIIQASSQRALEHGMNFHRTLELIARASVDVPVVLFSYLNPLLAAGSDALHRAADSGVDGVLVTDLPAGADPAREEWLGGGPLAYIRLVAPTTSGARMAEISAHGSGFVYLISRLGVTGVGTGVSASLGELIAALRTVTSLPICVGFGIAAPDQARAVASVADGVVVGSAVVREADTSVDGALALVRSIRVAMDA